MVSNIYTFKFLPPPIYHLQMTQTNILARAEEIVNCLNRQEPLVSANVMESAMNTLSEATVVYPKQTILCQLNPVSLAR